MCMDLSLVDTLHENEDAGGARWWKCSIGMLKDTMSQQLFQSPQNNHTWRANEQCFRDSPPSATGARLQSSNTPQPVSLSGFPPGLSPITPEALQWLVLAQVSGFIFLTKILLISAVRSVSGSLARVLLANVLLRFLGNFQRPSDGKG